MRIREVEIQDFLGTTYATFKPGTLTVISGANGSGKSSILAAVLAIFEGGHDPAWLRKGAKKGWIRLILDDGTTIVKSVSAKGSTLDITDPAGHIIPAPQTFVSQLADALRVDPARLLLAKPKDLLSVLLQVMPISFTAAEVEQATGRPAKDVDLDGLALIRKAIYEERTVANKAARDAEGTVATLRRSLPEQDEKDWGAEAASLQDQLRAVEKAVAEAREEMTAQSTNREHSIINDITAKIDALVKERQERIAAERAERDKALAGVDAEAKPIIEDHTARAAQARERADAQQRAAGVRESIDKFQRKIRDYSLASERLTSAIEALDRLRQQKLEALPIPGVEVADGKVLVDGVPWERVNTARRVEIAFAIWDLWQAPFALLDDAEHFDAETWAAFEEYCRNSQRQVIAARVSDGPLKIEVSEPTQ